MSVEKSIGDIPNPEEKRNLDLCKSGNSEFIRQLIQKFAPKKVVEMNVIQKESNFHLQECLCQMCTDTHIYMVEAVDYSRSGILKKKISEQIEAIGGEIDFLILDTYHRMPDEILDFIAVYPFLAKNAVVVINDTLIQYKGTDCGFASSVLFQNITAMKFDHHKEAYIDMIKRLELYGVDCRKITSAYEIFVGFQINADTRKYIYDLFSSLSVPWHYMPDMKYLKPYEDLVEKYYDSTCLRLYRQALENARQAFIPTKKTLRDMSTSLLLSFEYILIFGKRERGRLFLNLCKEQGIAIHGFIVSDGRPIMSQYEGHTVYNFSQVPFAVEKTLIFNTANSDDVRSCLQNSRYHWMDFSRCVLDSQNFKL